MKVDSGQGENVAPRYRKKPLRSSLRHFPPVARSFDTDANHLPQLMAEAPAITHSLSQATTGLVPTKNPPRRAGFLTGRRTPGRSALECSTETLVEALDATTGGRLLLLAGVEGVALGADVQGDCLLYTSPSPRD